MKAQIVMDARSKEVICTATGKGRQHDFKIFRESRVHFMEQTQVLADKGYQGICKLHKNSRHPIKATRRHKLTVEEKAYNAEISRRRMPIEHVNSYIKRFRILSTRYRNRRRRFGLRVSLICGIYNFQLHLHG